MLVHGGGDDSKGWQPQITGLADGFTVVAWDEPGAGLSSDVPEGFGLAEYADCLAALIVSLGLDCVHAAGISWGGTVVLELWRRHPALIASLILLDTYAGWKGSLPGDELRSRVEVSVCRSTSEICPKVSIPQTMANQLTVMADADLREVLPTISVPVLLVWGENDARSPLTIAREFAAAIPHAELVVVAGAVTSAICTGRRGERRHPTIRASDVGECVDVDGFSLARIEGIFRSLGLRGRSLPSSRKDRPAQLGSACSSEDDGSGLWNWVKNTVPVRASTAGVFGSPRSESS